jgi:glycosyltransferase involved in cell wall biosynthesis
MYFIPLLSTIGGQERTLIDKANYLVGNGHEVMFVTYEHEGPVVYELAPNVQHVDLNCHFFNLYKISFFQRLVETVRLKRHFRRKMKELLSEFYPDVIVIAIPNTENFICDVMIVSGNIPVVVESHLAQGYQVIQRGMTEKWLYYLYNPLNAIRKANLLVSLTKGDAYCWRRKGVNTIRVIPNPVTRYDAFMNQHKRKEGRIVCVGRLAPQKRFDRLIESFSLISSRYPTWYVDVFGDGEDKENLQRKILDLGLKDRIHLLPPTHDIYSEYLNSQFLALSSDFEGFGLVIVEAMACGIPVVATDCPFGPSEIIEDGKTGLLAKMDAKDLADKMEWMIIHDSERMAMGIKAHQAAAKYRKEVIMPQWEYIYKSVID